MSFIDWLYQYLNTNEAGDVEWSIEEILLTLEHIHDILLNQKYDVNEPWDYTHYGDCTQENISCKICEYQNWLDKYEDYCINIK